jgi:uncharacterized membrane protein YhaH (DUF805 family)
MDNDAVAGLLGLIVVVIVLLIYGVPAVRIVQKAGYSGWWCLLLLVPIVNIVMIWVFAFASWPSLRDRPN